MHQSLARYSAPVSLVHAPSWADFITTMVGFKVFGTHTGSEVRSRPRSQGRKRCFEVGRGLLISRAQPLIKRKGRRRYRPVPSGGNLLLRRRLVPDVDVWSNASLCTCVTISRRRPGSPILKNARSNLRISWFEAPVNFSFSIAPHKHELRLTARPIGRRPRIKMAAANRRCSPPENYRLLMKYSCPGVHLL